MSYYRNEAERCRKLAADSPDNDMAKRWRALADDYEKLAESLAASPPVPTARIRPPMQQQPMQQQQSKIEPEDK